MSVDGPHLHKVATADGPDLGNVVAGDEDCKTPETAASDEGWREPQAAAADKSDWRPEASAADRGDRGP